MFFLVTKKLVLFTEPWLTAHDISLTACCEHKAKSVIPAQVQQTLSCTVEEKHSTVCEKNAYPGARWEMHTVDVEKGYPAL